MHRRHAAGGTMPRAPATRSLNAVTDGPNAQLGANQYVKGR